MGTKQRAIEVSGTIDERHELHLDEPLTAARPGRVRVLILVPDDVDLSEEQWQRAAAANPAFDFLQAPEQDIYSATDGKPFRDEG